MIQALSEESLDGYILPGLAVSHDGKVSTN